MANGEKAAHTRVIGCEYEALVINPSSGRTVPYEGKSGIRALLTFMVEHFGWNPIYEKDALIALQKDNKSITLEPGGQFELSGAPVQTLDEVRTELQQHVHETETLEAHFGVCFQWRGLNPFQTVEEVNWMPKERYKIMRSYLPTRGKLSTTMMGLTCTVQTNLDYTDETHYSHILRTATGISPLVTAIFANSPWCKGDTRRYQSYRSLVWTQVDPDRCGIQPFIYNTDCGYADYVDWALDIPMFFLSGPNGYLNVSGTHSFRDLMEGRIPGHSATLDAWDLHLSTVFPEVRAKTHFEFRSADVVPPEFIPACPALWKGIVYSDTCLDAAWDLVKKWSLDQRRDFIQQVAFNGLRARLPVGAGLVQDMCKDLLEIASTGLQTQALDGLGNESDAELLLPLHGIVQSGISLADKVSPI